MRVFLIVIALVVIAGIGWFLVGADDTPTAVSNDAAPAAEADEPVAEPAAEAADPAAEPATEAAEGTAEPSGETAGEAAEGTADDAAPAQDAADAAAESTVGSAEQDESLADALTVEGFDAERLREAIAASDLTEGQKQAANVLVEQAELNPNMIQTVVAQLREELGL